MAARWAVLCGLVLGIGLAIAGDARAAEKDRSPAKYVRFQAGKTVAYGIVEGDRVRELAGDLFGAWKPTETMHALNEVKLLVPCQPHQVFAMAGNYRSHLGGDEKITTTITTTAKIVTNAKTGKTTNTVTSISDTASSSEVPKKFQIPQLFFKTISSLAANGDPIVIPKDATNVHYEAELVIVIGKEARKVSKEKALDYVLGVTCGNDVSERVWQKSDVQWWRAKGADTFGPCGPCIVTGLNYDDLLVQLRLNGKTLQKERTSQLIHNVPAMVSFISQTVTLYPGDLIYTGTSGETTAMKPGDVVEVEIEGIGVLRNPVVAETDAAAEATTAKHTANTAAPKYERDGKTIQRGFQARHDRFNERVKKGNVDVVFIGDSITEGWEGAGKQVWEKQYGKRNAVNLGIGGDRTQHVLWRLEHGNIDGIAPKAAVLMIGTNNSNGKDHTAEEIADGIKAIVAKLREKSPKTKVLVLAIFPRGEKPNPQREKNAKASELASKVADGKNVFFLDIGPKFLQEDGTLTAEIMPDRLHLSPQGYQIWADSIESKLKELMGE